jgi:hypothetical protein
MLAFEGRGAEMAEDRMPPLRVVEDLQALGHLGVHGERLAEVAPAEWSSL